MIPVISLSIALFLGVLTVWGVAAAAVGRLPQRGYLVAVAVAELELIAQAVIALAVIVGGHRPESVGEFLGYAVVSVALLPFALNRARSPEATRWDNAVTGVVCLAVAIAVLRLLSLW